MSFQKYLVDIIILLKILVMTLCRTKAQDFRARNDVWRGRSTGQILTPIYVGSGFDEEVKKAFEYALSIIEKELNLDEELPMVIQVKFEALTRPTIAYATTSHIIVQPVALPLPLYIQRRERATFTFLSLPFFTVVFDSNTIWYYGLDGKPDRYGSGWYKQDFVTVALHELLHGFGFASKALLYDNRPTKGRFVGNAHTIYMILI